MAAIKFSKQYIEPNPNEIDYWVDLSSNQYGGRMKYYNGFEWVDLVNPDGTHIDINDFYNKLQINQMLSQKASVDSVESKVDDDEVSDVIKNISFSQRGEDGVEMVMFKYDDTTVGIQLPVADNTKSGIITKDTFKNLVNQTQLQQLYSEMYTKLSEIRNNYQPKLRAGANIKIENNVISAVSKIGTDWNDIANKPDIYDKSQVDTMMSGVYKIKGSRRFEALPLYGNAVGDTYNITNDFSLHGEDYPLGTNVVWTENGWDALAGIFDTSELEEDIQEVKDNYLPLSGGKMSGGLSFDVNSSTTSSHVINFKSSTASGLLYLSGDTLKFNEGTNTNKLWHSGNDGEGSGLDADTLDGYHLDNVFANHDWKALDANERLFGVYYQGGSNSTNVPSKNGLLIAFNGNDTDYKGGLLFFRTNGSIETRTHWGNQWSDWKRIAFTDSDITGNAATATKLATPIKLWGNDFDGSSSVDSGIVVNQNGYITTSSTDVFTDTSGTKRPWYGLSFSSTTGNENQERVMLASYFGMTFKASDTRPFIFNGGSVGIGTNNPGSKLHVNGSIYSSSTIRGNYFIGSNDLGYFLLDSSGVANRSMCITTRNTLLLGHDTSEKGFGTMIDGNTMKLRYGTTHTNGLILNSSGNITIGESDFASTNHKLYVNGPLKINGVASFKYAMSLANDSHDFIRLSSGGDTDEYAYLLARNVVTGNNDGKLAITGYNAYKLNVALIKASNTNITGNLDVQDQITSGDLVDWYGVSWSEDSSNPTCTRIGNMALHRSLPIQSAMKGYSIININASSITEMIKPLTSDWSGTQFDDISNNFTSNVTRFKGSNVMVKIPEFWYIDDYETSTKTHNLKISQTAKAGWCHHKEAYVGAYEGYLGDVVYHSTSGVIPTVSATREQLRTKARANGYEDEYKWNIYTYEEHRAICHLFLVEYATRNSQAPVNTALTADGFKQGGLGSGCTTGSVTINGQTTYSFIPTGTTDSLGNGSGQVAYTVTLTDADGNEIGTVTRYANRYRGIENPFGHIWKHVDDVVNVYNAETTYKTVYKCNKPEHFATNKNAKYKPLCSFPGGSKMTGWSKEIKATINCDFFKYSIGGSESTYWCDYNYDNDNTTEHCLLIGGSSGDGGPVGLFCFHLSHSVGYSYVALGSRLTYLPWAE